MGENYDKVSEKIQNHLNQLVKTAGLNDEDDAVEMLAKAWLEKEDLFTQKIEESNMEEVDELDASGQKGGLLLTYSGSLVNVGPLNEGVRYVEYASIGIRKDVPEAASSDDAELAGNVMIDESAEFTTGPIQKSSPIYRIAIVKEDLDVEEEEEILAEVTQLLTDDFVEVNKTIISE